MRALLYLFAAVQAAAVARLLLFLRADRPYGPRNGHCMGGTATWYLASGPALLAAALLRSSSLPFRDLEPEWPDKVRRRVELARERLADYRRSASSVITAS